MTAPTPPILDLVNGGNQRSGDGRAGINSRVCGRQGCQQAPHEQFSFCRDCLAWLRGETDDDPLADDDDPATWEAPPDMWVPYMQMLEMRDIQ